MEITIITKFDRGDRCFFMQNGNIAIGFIRDFHLKENTNADRTKDYSVLYKIKNRI